MPPVVEYANPVLGEDSLARRRMRRWRDRCGQCFLFAAFGAFIYMPFACVAGVCTLACAVMTLFYLAVWASAEVSPGYAARQVALAVLLSPIFLAGIFIVPPLVESDIFSWSEMENKRSAEENRKTERPSKLSAR